MKFPTCFLPVLTFQLLLSISFALSAFLCTLKVFLSDYFLRLSMRLSICKPSHRRRFATLRLLFSVLSDVGGNKWTRTTDIFLLMSGFSPFFPVLSDVGGNKWTRTTDIFCLCRVSRPFFPVLSDVGGNKWTRTTDLTLIRRVL